MRLKSFSIPLSILCLCVTFGLGGCRPDPRKLAEEKIAKAVSEVRLPLVYKGITVTGMTYEDHTLIIRNQISPDTLAAIDKDVLKERALANLRMNMGKVLSRLSEADADVQYVYYNDTDSLKFTFTPEDFK
ncbi:MAG: hypothetical protein HDS25_00680 [Bacteroides sp.]|nr:hypothetical protein [Bacteroides sp.]